MYDKEECEDQYGAWGNWTECRLSGSCGDSYGFWERDRTVCSGDDDVFTQYEVSVCAEGFSGDDCTTCEDDYWMNSSGDCIGNEGVILNSMLTNKLSMTILIF